MAVDGEAFMGAADDLLAKLEKSALVSKTEMEAVRKDLTRQLKGDAKGAAKNLQFKQIGRTKVLIPNSSNLRDLRLSTERSRSRMSQFRLSYLNPDQVRKLKSDGRTLSDNPREFIRHSRRLARHAREFLAKIEELEPDLSEEVQETLFQLEDANMNLLKLEVQSFTRLRETMLRSVGGRKRRSELLKEIESFDLNRNLWNLSLLEHPKATVRAMFANSSESMASRVTTKISQIPKRAHVMVGIPPDAVSKMTPDSRAAKIAWRLFTAEELSKRFAAASATKKSATSWRGLGLDFNTPEWYVPVPPESLPEVKKLARARRSALLRRLQGLKEEGL